MKERGTVYFHEIGNEFSEDVITEIKARKEDLSNNLFDNKYCEGVRIDFNGYVYIVPSKVDEFKRKIDDLVSEFQKEFGV
ncbi:hypothetical protein [Campylobacter sp. JMF_03 NE3]|uniref:hypothetical protein n=1 Tax=Campylobacter sp. JMF_03 NE3 TaxID=2983831 RepID=UPI0022E9B038|nr:hypothetical protein [Campylobacter sp. JMF_03 NE3]MDA3053613.1 hypothetical protein [Campylobacter sp. JMF_03 NE3]